MRPSVSSSSAAAASGVLYALSILLPSVAALAPLEGYGKDEYPFECGAVCQYVMPTNFDCPEYANMTEEERAEAYPSPECLANNIDYLTSIAWCINQKCPPDTSRWEIEQYWETLMIYDHGVPRLGYTEALAMVDPKNPPKPLSPDETVFNRTISVPDAKYNAIDNGLRGYKIIEKNQNKYSLVVFLSCVLIPMGFSFLRFLPIPESITTKVNAYLIDPPAWGRKHLVPTLGLGLVPTRGQALFILYIIAINCVASFEGYPNWTPNGIFPNEHIRLLRFIGNRTGVIAFANIPIVILYAGRNSVLLHLTNWSHSTFLLLHRWIGTICVIQVILHSLLWLRLMIEQLSYPEVLEYPYWWWGIIGTVFFSVLLPFSVLPMRKVLYELFIIFHIIFTVMALVGSWYHIWFLYEGDGGFEIWLIIAFILWGVERLVRVLRFARHGVKQAYVTRIDDKYIRVDIPNVNAHGHCYAYFPGVSWRVWENHPFSVVEYSDADASAGGKSADSKSSSQEQFEAKVPVTNVEPLTSKEAGGEISATQSITSSNDKRSRPGITLFIQPHKGLTSKLAKHADTGKPVSVLIEGSYGHSASSFNPTAEYPNTLVIAGGVGIAGVLSALQGSLSLFAAPVGSTKLYWGIKKPGLVNTVKSILVGETMDESVEGNGQLSHWGHVETRVTVGARMDIKQVVTKEVEAASGGTTVIVCGPNSMCDDVRYVCAALARHGAKVRYVEEAFSW